MKPEKVSITGPKPEKNYEWSYAHEAMSMVKFSSYLAVLYSGVSLLAEALFLLFADKRKESVFSRPANNRERASADD